MPLPSFIEIVDFKEELERLEEKQGDVQVAWRQTPMFKAVVKNTDASGMPHAVKFRFYQREGGLQRDTSELDFGQVYAGVGVMGVKAVPRGENRDFVFVGCEVDGAFVPAQDMDLGRFDLAYAQSPCVLQKNLTEPARVLCPPPPPPNPVQQPAPVAAPSVFARLWKRKGTVAGVVGAFIAAGLLITYKPVHREPEFGIDPATVRLYKQLEGKARADKPVLPARTSAAAPKEQRRLTR